MEADSYKYARTCHKCQIYAVKIYVPLNPLNVLSFPWTFAIWDIDMIGMIELKASNEHWFILVAINYFTKWVKATSYTSMTKQVITRFIKQNIICRYEVPNKIIIDNGSNFNNNMIRNYARVLRSNILIHHPIDPR